MADLPLAYCWGDWAKTPEVMYWGGEAGRNAAQIASFADLRVTAVCPSLQFGVGNDAT